MKTTIRLHSFEGTNDGTVSCDFRGDKFIGAADGDHHQTLREYDVEETDPIVEKILKVGPEVNQLFALMESPIEGAVGSVLGMKVGLRIGVWDKTAPKH